MSFDEKADTYLPPNVASPTSMGRARRRRRKEIGKTMRQIAEEVGLSEGFISQVERGLSTPSLISLYNLSSTLEASVEALLAQVPQRDLPMASDAAEPPDYSLYEEGRVYHLLRRGFPKAQLNSCITHMPPVYVSELTRHEGEDFFFVIDGGNALRGRRQGVRSQDRRHPAFTNFAAAPRSQYWHLVGAQTLGRHDSDSARTLKPR